MPARRRRRRVRCRRRLPRSATRAARRDRWHSGSSAQWRRCRGTRGSSRRVLAAHAPDVVHSHGIKTHVLAALTRRKAPVVWHLHDYVGLRSVSSKLLPRLARRCDLAIAVSHSVADDARRWLPSRLRVEVVHNAVDTDRFTPSGEALDLGRGLGPRPGGAWNDSDRPAGDVRAVEGARDLHPLDCGARTAGRARVRDRRPGVPDR